MSVRNLETRSPEAWDYAFRDKLWGHEKRRSEIAFEKAKEVRAAINTKEVLQEYIDTLGLDTLDLCSRNLTRKETVL